MALYHFNVTQVSRGKGQSSVASASYISGEKLYDKSSHKLRFTVASTLKAAGVETAYLQKTLGHSNRAMTEHYINETVEEPKNIEDQLMNALSIC